MSQHDYNIANATFPSVRSDINDALGAVATNNAGNSAPSTTYANQWWFDSDGDQLYIRNKDNDAWVKVFKIGATSDLISEIATDSLILGGTTPTLTIGDGGAEDAKIIFDGNAQNFHIGLDDSTDKLTIGLGNALGTYPAITIDENTNVVIPDSSLTIIGTGNYDLLTLKSTDADANVGPVMNYYRNSSSPADNDYIGKTVYVGRNDNSQDVNYVAINVQANDVSDGSEDGSYVINTMRAGALDQTFSITPSEVIINDDSKDVDFRVESNGNANMLFVDGGNNRVHINGTTGTREFNVSGDNTRLLLYSTNNSTGACQLHFGDADDEQVGRIMYEHDGNKMTFHTNASERMRIDSAGVAMFNTTNTAVAANAVGVVIGDDGYASFRRGSASIMYLNRFTNDGTLVQFHQAGTEEGSISVSGSTVSYNGFTGGHWSRLADNSKPSILRGTIMDSIDEMCDWYQAVAEVAESTDDEGNVTPAQTVKESIALGDKSVGDAITFTSNGTEYTGTIVKEDDVKHTKCKVSDTADSKKVYGVFSNWDDADDGLDGDVNDMNIAQVGTFIIRVNADVTVEAGDLLVSNGDGTAKLQDDDIIRSKTVAKVNSTVKIETYADGSYTVPCTLHC